VDVCREIRALHGMQAFKALADKLLALAAAREAGADVRLPGYLFVDAPGAGTSTRLRLLARLLEETGLWRFSGERTAFEWMLDAKAFEPEGGFDRLLEEIACMAGFRGRFCGVIGLDVDCWVSRADRKEFSRLLELVRAARGDILFVFIVRERRGEEMADFVRRLSWVTPLEVVRSPLPARREMARCMAGFLFARGIETRADAALEQTVEALSSLRGFHGLCTLELAAEEAAYRLRCADAAPRMRVRGEDVARALSGEGGLLQRLALRSPARRMGFAEGGSGE